MPSPSYPFRAALFALFTLATLIFPPLARPARAHSPTFSVYSKYEATIYERSIAVVFALDKAALLQLLEQEAVHAKVETQDVEAQRAFFSRYLFDRFTIANDGAACAHPDQLSRFFWDESTGRVLAVTKFTCPQDLHELTIHSVVTHDMPTSHELVGDLEYHGALVRDFFANEDNEAHITLASLKPGMEPAAPKRRGKFSYVPVPDRVRRYDSYARAELEIDAAQATQAAQMQAPAEVPRSATLLHFIGEGIKHIFTGYDHVLFIVTLIFAVGTWRKLAVIVTSFTAAHSITLVLATLGVVSLPSKIVEPLIAASVLYVAVDAVVRPNASTRAAVTFGFGLLHGFGLSSVLRDLGLTGRELAPALLGFNVGVEIGQLLIVAPLFPLILILRRKETTYARARSILCTSVAAIATLWIVMRVWEAFRA